ncbi:MULTISPECIES: alpha/beta hydrolase [unclassified Tolypothrix]|uniref:alpha/beta hydrolase n=1 Tax=unclassified Tolypothrix TaxID=2649714 RepID=UPI00143BBDF4|nr:MULTISPECIES: alpha/beta hydrolase [unclassified Tolypothrix]UYD37288.1 alpha/beta hydrolase [Tolypothrix sp. PCC 7601]
MGTGETREMREKFPLLITHYSLLITHYSLLITHYPLLITHYQTLPIKVRI